MRARGWDRHSLGIPLISKNSYRSLSLSLSISMHARVHALGFGYLHSGPALQIGNNGFGRRRLRLLKLKRPVSSFSSGKRPASSEGDREPQTQFLGRSKDTSRKDITQRPHSRWWYGEDGELESTLPCPDCRGRGYIVCPLCDIATPDSSCTECHGKGLKTCSRCLGKRAILMQPVYEDIPLWEENKARGPLLEIEDDDDDEDMDIQVFPDRKSKRIYRSHTAEVRQKIRQALKSLDARTGSVTRRMRRIHSDPVLNAKRIAAIKKAKCTEAARKQTSEQLRLFFQEPRNRLLRSLSVKGATYYCSQCGAKGHRRNYCPDLPTSTIPMSTSVRSYHCSICGQSGHMRTSCHRVSQSVKDNLLGKRKCGICKEVGHNARSCPKRHEKEGDDHGVATGEGV